jgi:hypothetical protein
MGGPGVGQGGKAPEREHAVDFQETRVKGKLDKGSIMTLGFRKGVPKKGPGLKEYDEQLQDAREKLQEGAVSHDRLPAIYDKTLQNYFHEEEPKAEGEVKGKE